MNRLLSALILFMSVLTSAGQNGSEGNAWSVPRAGGDGIIEPSPEVAAMRRYTDFPVSYASGTVDVSIPLLTMPDGLADITIGITCQTGGIKRQDFQSAVGLGWTLTGLGCVSRQINGFPDEWHGGHYQSVSFDMRESPYDTDYLRSIVECRTETEYDRYSYSIPGYSGSFIIADGRIVQLPSTEVNITRTADRQNPMATESFTLTTPEGLVYRMTEQEHTSYSYIPHPQEAFFFDRSYEGVVTAWHVTGISHPESPDDVKISYYPMQAWARNNTVSLMTYSYTVMTGNPMKDPMSETTGHDGSTNRTVFHNQRLPYEIRTGVGRVLFDIFMKYDGIIHDRPLEYLRGMTQYDNEHNIIRKVSFDNGNLFSDGRRRLDGVTVTQDGTVTGRYRFTYVSGTDADGYDVFGYPNGSRKEPMESFSVLDSRLELSQIRRPSHYWSSGNSLKTITDITGLTTTLRYESSSMTVSGSGLFRGTAGIGIRVAGITVHDPVTGRYRNRSFSYEKPMCDIALGELTYEDFISQSGTHFADDMAGTFSYTLGVPYLASSRLGGYPVEQARIHYGKVTETVSGTGLDKPMMTVYEYDLTNLRKPFITSEWHGFHDTSLHNAAECGKNLGSLEYCFIGQNDKDHKLLRLNVTRGYFKETAGAMPLLKRKTLYEYTGGEYRERQSEEYTYTSHVIDNIRTGIHCESVVFRFFEPNTMTQVSTNITDMNDMYYFVTYISTRRDLLSTVTRTIHYPDGNSRSVKTVSRYFHEKNPTDRLPGFDTDTLKAFTSSCRHPVATTVSSGDESVTMYSARSEHAVLSPVLSQANMNNIRHLPVADRWIFETPHGRDTVSRRYIYARYDMDGGGMMTKPCRVSVESGGQLVSEQCYSGYDMFGNITSMTDNDGRRITAEWLPGYCLLSRMTLPDVGLTTTYTHRPLVGCTSITSPGGKTVRYGYDAGRLTSVRDTGGELLEEHDYLYYDDGTENCGSNRIRTTVYDASGRNTHPQARSGPMRTSVAIWPDTTSVKDEPETGVWEDDEGYGEECGDCETETSSVRTVHYDGFGMPVQTVGTVAGGSLVRTATEYDALDRPVRQYLPVPATDDSFLTLFHTAASSHYGDNYPYSQVTYRGMPGDRPLQVLMEGEAMQGHPATYGYLCNSDSLDRLRCRRYRLAPQRDNEQITLDGNYPAGALDVTETADPDGCVQLTFTDWRGFTVLQRKVLNESAFADTYYLYDIRGDIRVILQPEAVIRMTQDGKNWTGSDEELDKFAFINRYDRRGNCIYAKTPGGGAAEMRYDRYNRLAYRQTAVMRERGEAEFTLYDQIGRVALCGITPNGLPETVPEMTTRYDGSDIAGSIDGTGYTVPDDPDIPDAAVTRVNYYDSYDCLRLDGFASLPNGDFYPDSSAVRGRLAATRIALYRHSDSGYSVSGAGESLYSVYCYDSEGRVMTEISSTMLEDIYHTVTHRYSRQGYETECTEHVNVTGSLNQLRYTAEYDPAGNILSAAAMPGNRSDPQPGTAVSPQYIYDELGRLSQVRAGITVGYSYDMRGRLTGIVSPVFSQTIEYEAGQYPCYNGNISVMRTSGHEGTPDVRMFSYDRLNRLTSMSSSHGSVTWYGYNLNSSPTGITRRGLLSDGTVGYVDDLTMSYDGNRLIRVTDDADPVLLESSCDFNGHESEYGYDADGALYSDTSRGIASVEYAPSGQPVAIRDSDGALIARYAYSADGRKLSSGLSYFQGQRPVSDRHYIGSFEFLKPDRKVMDDAQLERIRIPWGEILYDSTVLLHIQDYQGNVCAVTEPVTGIVEQTTCYYPYGLPTATSTGQAQNRYKYSGKEFETVRGMNRYDFHARRYDPAFGLFDRPDPMATGYPWLNPYLYCAANPVMNIDPTGEVWVERYFDGVREIMYDRNVLSLRDLETTDYFKDSKYNGVRLLDDGETITLGGKDYSFFNDYKGNKNGLVVSEHRLMSDNRIISGETFDIFGTSDDSCDPLSLHGNLMGTSYTGPTNPYTYGNKRVPSYQYIPRNMSEIASMAHDKAYDRAGAKGTTDALFNVNVIDADMEFVRANRYVARHGSSYADRCRAGLACVVFLDIAFKKKIYASIISLMK